MYEDWRIQFTAHAKRRMVERLADETEVREVIVHPDTVSPDQEHGGRLLTKYLPDWDRILMVAIEERVSEGILLVKTVLWSKVN